MADLESLTHLVPLDTSVAMIGQETKKLHQIFEGARRAKKTPLLAPIKTGPPRAPSEIWCNFFVSWAISATEVSKGI